MTAKVGDGAGEDIHTVDARGLRCPAPIIALGRAASEIPGNVAELLSDDPATEADLPAWERLTGGQVLAVRDAGRGARAYRVRLPGGRPPNAGGSDTSPPRDSR